jgi:Ser/Thr protein kinase RdoA (MazF antagonist)
MSAHGISPALLQRWPGFDAAAIRRFGTGLINGTFLVETGGDRFVLQQLHPIFAGSVNRDLDAVTRHLAAKGLVTPRLVPASDGTLWADDGEGRSWRVLTFVDGESVDAVEGPARAFEAGRLVARFHAALTDLDHDYVHVRAGVHDTARHLQTLEAALEQHRDHRLYDRVAPVAEALLEASRVRPDFGALPRRHAHGDLKISNLMFGADRRGLCLVDLDTLGRMPWPHELGDALRSWCNPAGEDATDNRIDPALFEAAVRGYASEGRGAVGPNERELLVAGVATIALELSARFLADALKESYFGWNPARFASRGEHNLVRGLGQWSLARSVESGRAGLERQVRSAFDG